MPNYAIIGQGFIWPRHKAAIEATGGIVKLRCDLQHPKIYPDFLDWVQMYNSPRFKEIDTVVILTPNYLHSTMAREAIRLGKKVICEKPLTIFDDYTGLDDVSTVLQLRYNPLLQEMKAKIGPKSYVSFKVETYREDTYFNSWKGNSELSGGILYNMGIHYFDILLQLLGKPLEIVSCDLKEREAQGEIRFEKGRGVFHLSLNGQPGPAIRSFSINEEFFDFDGATIPLKDTGEVINLHTEVYKAINNGNALTLKDVKPSLDLVAALKAHGENRN